MRTYSLTHLSDRDLLRDLTALVSQDCATTALLLAHLAEVEARRLYLPAGYSSMFEYGVHELRLSEDSACRRIRASRVARQFPAIFVAVAERRLHLSGVVTLAPHLTPENVDELLDAAAHKTKAEIERLLARRFPRPDLPTGIQALPSPLAAVLPGEPGDGSSALARIEVPLVPEPGTPRPRVAPLSPQRFSLQLTMGQEMHDKLCYAQALLGHQVPSGDVVQVLERALDVLIAKLEQRKFGATSRPRPGRGSSGHGRYIPAEVRARCVRGIKGSAHARSNGASRRARRVEAGTRTATRAGLRTDVEIAAIAATVEATTSAPLEVDAQAIAEADARAEAREQARDVMAGLMNLGVRADAARRAAEYSEALPVATLEERIRAAIRYLHPKHVRSPIGTAPGAPA